MLPIDRPNVVASVVFDSKTHALVTARYNDALVVYTINATNPKLLEITFHVSDNAATVLANPAAVTTAVIGGKTCALVIDTNGFHITDVDDPTNPERTDSMPSNDKTYLTLSNTLLVL